MQQVKSVVRCRSVDVSAIQTDIDVLKIIADDMIVNAGKLLPIATWITSDPNTGKNDDAITTAHSTFAGAETTARFGQMDRLMYAWLGPSVAPVSSRTLADYEVMFRKHDPLGLWQANVEDRSVRATLRESDLASMLELQLLYSFAPHKMKTTIVEVGGGYGRLAEAALNVFGDSIRYVLVDAVPASMAYAKEYLTRACPDRKIGLYYSGDSLDLDRFDCYIVPAWRFEEQWTRLGIKADACLNIQSFQEMAQVHVDHYLELFDRVSGIGSVIISINSREHLFRGALNYPKHWKRVLAAYLPRSAFYRSPPTEVFTKAVGDFSIENSMIEACNEFSYRAAHRLINPVLFSAPGNFAQRLRTKMRTFRGTRPN